MKAIIETEGKEMNENLTGKLKQALDLINSYSHIKPLFDANIILQECINLITEGETDGNNQNSLEATWKQT